MTPHTSSPHHTLVRQARSLPFLAGKEGSPGRTGQEPQRDAAGITPHAPVVPVPVRVLVLAQLGQDVLQVVLLTGYMTGTLMTGQPPK